MSPEKSRYISLLALAADWGAAAGVPKELVLRRLCEWAMAGAFPEGAFITATGAQVKPFDIYMSFRAFADDNNGVLSRGIDVDGWTFYNTHQQWGVNVLGAALVTASDVSLFCEHTETLPPPSLLRGVLRFLARWGTKQFAPPECPDAAKHAVRFVARESAVSCLNSLRSILSAVQGKPDGYARHSGRNEPHDLQHWSVEWKKSYDRAEHGIAQCEDSGLQQELALLSAEWAAFLEAHPMSLNSGENQGKPAGEIAAAEQPRRRGRPPGSGYEAADEPLIDEMREAITTDPSLSATKAAFNLAARARGGGTIESKAKRLAEGYSAKFGNQPRK